MIDELQTLREYRIIEALGLLGVFSCMLGNGIIGIPPSEIVCLIGGYFAAQGEFSAYHVGFLCVLGNTLGHCFWFGVSAKFGKPFFDRPRIRYIVHYKVISYAERLFQKYGPITISAGRMVPGLRTHISIPAGLFSMPPAKFLIYTVVGNSAWCFTWVIIGYRWGPAFLSWLHATHRTAAPIAVYLLLLAALVTIIRYRAQISDRIITYWVQHDMRKQMPIAESFISGTTEDPPASHSANQTITNRTTPDMELQQYGLHFLRSIYHPGPTQAADYQATYSLDADYVVDKLVHIYQRATAAALTDSMLMPECPVNLREQLREATRQIQLGHLKPDVEGLGPLGNVLEAIAFVSKENPIVNLTKLLEPQRGAGKFIGRPSLTHYVHCATSVMKRAIQDILDYSAEYDVTFNVEDQTRCLYNAFNLLLHYMVLQGKVALNKSDRRLIYILSALHPIEDDYIDRLGYSGEVLVAIQERLGGKPIDSKDAGPARPLLKMIDDLYSHFLPEEHPDLVHILTRLHDVQIASLAQSSNRAVPCDMKELLSLTFLKGGYAFAFYGYVALLGSMTASQFRHFFTMGAIFQLMDDFHDVQDDLSANVLTPFTVPLLKNQTLDEAVYGTLAVSHAFDRLVESSSDFMHPVLTRMVTLFGWRYDLLRFWCMHQEHCSPLFNSEFESKLPFPLESAKLFFRGTREFETLENYIEILTKVREMSSS